jgi:hypothetical protein
MRIIFASLAALFILSACTKELSKESPVPPNGGGGNNLLPDTAFSLKRKIVYYYNGTQDSAITLYRNNTVNGVKGYIVSDTSTATGSTAIYNFKYDNNNRLIEIAEARYHSNRPPNANYYFNWSGKEISSVVWMEGSTVEMNRKYNYQYAGDSMIIGTSYKNISFAYYDSTVVRLVADTNWLKLRRETISDTFRYTGPGNNYSRRSFFTKRFTYAANDISTINTQNETSFYNSPFSYSRITDTTTMNLSHATQVNNVLNDMENKYFGKEIRLLAYDINDSLSLINEFFTYGDQSADYISYNTSFDNWYDNIYGAAYHPVTETRISAKNYRDGVVYAQANNFLQHQVVYTLDSQNRIVYIKELDTATNTMVKEIFYTYY